MGNNRKIFNDEIINLIVNVLQICDKIRAIKKNSDFFSVKVKALGDGSEIEYKGEHGFAEELLNYVFFACQKSLYQYKLSGVRKDKSESNDNVYIDLEDKLQNLCFDKNTSFPDFKKIRDAVADLFIREELKIDLQIKLNYYEQMVNSYKFREEFINREEIKECLLGYTDILTFLLINEEIIEEIGKKAILKPLLNFCDLENIEDKGYTSLSMFSPISLYLLLAIYYRLDEYLELEIRENEEDFEAIYHEIFTKKVLHAYRWFLADENSHLYQAEISPFIENRLDDHKLMIPVNMLQMYDSFEGVRELRLAEKIIYELELYKQGSEYNIAVLGDLQKQPVEELAEYLTKIIRNKISVIDTFDCSNIKINFDVYTKTIYKENERTGTVGNCFYSFYELDDILINRQRLDEILSKHQMLFFLDNLDLYGKVYVEDYLNPEFYKQRLKYYDYKKVLDEVKSHKDIVCDGVFKELHETLTAYLYSGRWGRFKKNANNTLLQYLEDKVYKEDEKKTIYVYVSDLNAFHELYCNDKYFVRKEQYANKEIGIIRYSQRSEQILSNVDGPYMLVFNLWQFVKHIAIDERTYFLGKLLPGFENEVDLKQIHIGIQYGNWKERLVFDYYLEEELEKEEKILVEVKNFIGNTLIPLFNEKVDDMYSGYIHKSVCSFLYSDVASVEDMLFVHLYKNHRKIIGKAVLNEVHAPSLVKKHINKSFKYSFKRFYEMALESYDISASEYIGQYKTIEMIEKSDDLKNALKGYEDEHQMMEKGARYVLFKQIANACEHLNYMDSYIYIRSKAEAEME